MTVEELMNKEQCQTIRLSWACFQTALRTPGWCCWRCW